MPRTTLPRITANMMTMEVLITQTKEETIRAHLEAKQEWFEETLEVYRKHLSKLVDAFANSDPYAKYTIEDWRAQRPSMKHKRDKMRWITDYGEQFTDTYTEMLKFKNDYRLCFKAFPEWEDWLLDTVMLIERTTLDTDELLMYESLRYNESRKRYEERDAHFIAERWATTRHFENHLSPEQFMMADTFTRSVIYENKEPEYWVTCRWCIRDSEEKRAQAEADRLVNEKGAREIEAFEKRQREAQVQADAEKEEFTCECCAYKTSNIDGYDRHMESREHKIKENQARWFCACCSTQSRSENEHTFHMNSTKHKKLSGQIKDEDKEPVKFVCECCAYETPRKDLFNRHMVSNKHLANAKSFAK